MDLSKSKSTAPEAGLGVGGPFSNLKDNGSASLAELKEFLSSLRGRSPQEVIGIISSSLLIQSVGLAAAATLALIAVFTIVPYMLYGPPKKPQEAAAAQNSPAQTAAEEKPAAKTGDETAAGDATTSADAEQPDAEKAAKVLGIEETKGADPKVNPLEKNLDKLLDGVE